MRRVPRGECRLRCPTFDTAAPLPEGTRDKFKKLGVEKFCQWVREQKPLLWTDTTMRDAHQSLLATRVRTYDLLAIADVYARDCAGLFSLEMWGGATFDTSMRFLKESPWQRLEQLARTDSEHLVPNAAARVERNGICELSGQRRSRVRSRGGGRGHGRVPHLRCAQLDAEHARGDGSHDRVRSDLRSGHLLHGRHPRSASAEV